MVDEFYILLSRLENALKDGDKQLLLSDVVKIMQETRDQAEKEEQEMNLTFDPNWD